MSRIGFIWYMVNFTGRKNPKHSVCTNWASAAGKLVFNKICCKFSLGNIKRKISTRDCQSEADEHHMNIPLFIRSRTSADRVWSNPKKDIYQSLISKIWSSIRYYTYVHIYIYLQNIHNFWPVIFLRSLVISEPPDIDGIGGKQEVHMALASMNLYTCERCLAWGYGRYANFLEIFKTNVRFWLRNCIFFLQDSG